MQKEIENLIDKSSEMGKAIERGEIFIMVVEKFNEAVAKKQIEVATALHEILGEIASKTTSKTTSDTTKGDN
jgi:hypothetical protein